MSTHRGGLVVWDVAIAKEDQGQQGTFVEDEKVVEILKYGREKEWFCFFSLNDQHLIRFHCIMIVHQDLLCN
jgi:hypothetical protein